MSDLRSEDSFKVGDLVKFTVKGISNSRVYKVRGRIKEIIGPIAKVTYFQPYCRYHNGRRTNPFYLRDLKPFKPLKPEIHESL